ncbi:MAG: phytanoyl-CoA dioxygenase family protein [Microthrixaceae bacterium]
MTLDLRTRRDDEARERIAPDSFFGETLPSLLRAHADLIPSADEFDLRPLVLRVDGRAWRLHRDGDGSPAAMPIGDDDTVAATADGPPVAEVRLTAEQFDDLLADQVTPIGLMTAGTLDQPHGRIGGVLDWWLVLRAVLDRRRIHRRGDVDVPVDLGRRFTLDDDPDEILAFLGTAGFVHLRGVFTAAEMAGVSDDMDRAVPNYMPGDGDSWWATLADGSEQVVRMQRFERHSATVSSILEDPRLLRVAEIARCGHTTEWATDNRVEALFKPIGVVSGISDIPWHKDCSLGRHSYECCGLTVGVSVTGAGPTSGQLRVIAGSHRALLWPALLDTGALDLPDVALATDVGDVTVHLSCTLHMAQAPTETPRRVLYTGFRLPPTGDDESRSANRRKLKASREGAPRNTSQPPAR